MNSDFYLHYQSAQTGDDSKDKSHYLIDLLDSNELIYSDDDNGFNKTNYLQSLDQLKINISKNSEDDLPNNIQKILDENVNSLQNSISLFYNMHKSQIDDIDRVAEEYYFALNQLNRENEIIMQNKNKVQSEFNSIESIHSQLIKEAASINDSKKLTNKNAEGDLPFLLNHYIFKYEKRCQKISMKTKDIKNQIKKLKSQSIQNKMQIQFLNQKQNNLNDKLNEIRNQVNQITELRNNHFDKLISLKRTNKLIYHINYLIIQSKAKRDSLRINEKLLLQKINEINKKELILKKETKEINELQKIIEQQKNDIKRTKLIKDDVEKPLLLVYNEIKDNIQEELQKEIILDQKLNFLNMNDHVLNSNNCIVFNESQINSMKKQLSDLDSDCSILRDEIVNQSKINFRLLNKINKLENEKNLKLDGIYKMNTHHNGNVAVLFDYAINRSDLDYISKLQKQIAEKKENLKARKIKYLKKCDALITVLENFISKYRNDY